MRLHPSSRTLGLTASMLSIAILVPAAALAVGPRDGTCDPVGTGPNGPAAAAPAMGAGNGRGAAFQPNGAGGGNGPRVQANGNGRGPNGNADRFGTRNQAAWQASRRGPGTGFGQPAMGVLTPDQQADLQAMAEEEKLAHDVYTQLGALLGGPELQRIAASESNHLAAVQRLLARYGLDDPTAGKPIGTFATKAFQDLHDQFLTQGSVSLAAAHDVGVAIEQDDLGRLADVTAGLSAPDVLRVYANLAKASERHLAAFNAL